MLGLGSMVGTGVFVAIGLGAGAAGWGLLPAVVLAGGLAWCNALSSAQLAAAHPVAGGTYEYGHRYLTPAWGAVAGFMFLVAKSASAATAALGLAAYGWGLFGFPDAGASLRIGAGLVVVLSLMTLVLEGMKRTTAVNTVIVCVTLVSLGIFVVAAFVSTLRQGDVVIDWGNTMYWFELREDGAASTSGTSIDAEPSARHRPISPTGFTMDGWLGVAWATALMFVAYTGYGRIATLAEEVRSPVRTIPRAVAVTMTVTVMTYAAVALAALFAVGPDALAKLTADGAAPLEAALRGVDAPVWTVWLVAVGAVTAMVGVVLNLLFGLSRVALAMGRRGHLPGVFARVDPTGTTPAPAVLLVTAIVLGLVLVGSIRHAWSLSAVTVLVYYGLTNAAALRLPPDDRRYPRAFAWVGLAGCLGLSVMVEWEYVALGAGLVALALIAHALTANARRAKENRGAEPRG